MQKKGNYLYVLIVLAFFISALIGYFGTKNEDKTTNESDTTVVENESKDNDIDLEYNNDINDKDDSQIGDLDKADNNLDTDDGTEKENIEDDIKDVDAFVSELKFRNDKLLSDHYKKHGIEMGFDSKEDYQLAAAKVVYNKDALHKIESEDGDDIYYLEETNEFVVVSTDGYIRTYFYPSGGKSYFDRQ